MNSIQALSRLRANMLEPTNAWEMACEHLHESMGWSAVLSHALKAKPTLHPELFAILNTVMPGEDTSIAAAFEDLKAWASTRDEKDLGPALAIWASQTQIEQCTVAELIKSTPLSWRWDMAVSLMPMGQTRADHQTLIQVLWMSNMVRNQSRDQHLDPSMLSNVFFS